MIGGLIPCVGQKLDQDFGSVKRVGVPKGLFDKESSGGAFGVGAFFHRVDLPRDTETITSPHCTPKDPPQISAILGEIDSLLDLFGVRKDRLVFGGNEGFDIFGKETFAEGDLPFFGGSDAFLNTIFPVKTCEAFPLMQKADGSGLFEKDALEVGFGPRASVKMGRKSSPSEGGLEIATTEFFVEAAFGEITESRATIFPDRKGSFEVPTRIGEGGSARAAVKGVSQGARAVGVDLDGEDRVCFVGVLGPSGCGDISEGFREGVVGFGGGFGCFGCFGGMGWDGVFG